ncbi:MAG TPA: MoaD/ThiS family protein [Chthoniobacterales bacterium]|jgi:molybdopterin converting factor small subunit|nr:MoaD/ThiS family protein [Chthoniobacterales bacterium]
MQITVQFYSQLREIVGAAELSLRLPEQTTVAELLRQLYRAHPGLEKWDGNILLGVGLEFVGRDYVLQPNDQVAIMPPVQGG